MQCEKCRKERERGQEYWFHYGNKVMETERFDIDQLATFKNTMYLLAGEQSAWICHRCTSLNYRVMLAGLIIVGVVSFFVLIGLSSDVAGGGTQTLLGGIVCCGLPWVVALIVLILRREKMSASIGEAFAINLKKDALKHQGYDTFFNSVEYQRLQQNK